MMTPRSSTSRLLVLLLVLVPFASGCDSGGEDKAVSEAALAAFDDMMGDVFGVMSLVVAQLEAGVRRAPATKQGDTQTPADLLTCPQGGQVEYDGDVSGDNSTLSFDISMDLQNCNGIDGSLTTSGNGTFTETTLDFTVLMDGDLEGTCSVSLDQFSEALAANSTTNDVTIMLDGTIGANCNGEQFTCNVKGLTIDQNSTADDFGSVCSRD